MEVEMRPPADETVPWDFLPLHIVKRIFSLLSQDDRYSMSLVCELWYQELHHPDCWKTFKFAIGPSALRRDSWPVMNIVRAYCNKFKHIEIAFNPDIEMHLLDRWIDWLLIFLLYVRESQLMSMDIWHLRSFFRLVPIKNFVLRLIADFLRSQRELVQLRMGNCFYAYADNLEIITALIENNSQTIVQVNLESTSYISHKRCDVPPDERILPSLIQETNLRHLFTDYSLILGDHSDPSIPLGLIRNSQNLTWLSLQLSLSEFSENFKRFESSQWEVLRKEKPNLKIQLFLVTTSRHTEQLESLIVPGMPIISISYNFLKGSDDMDPEIFLEKIVSCNANDNLVDMFLYLQSLTIDNLYSLCTPFLNACPKLERFYLFTKYPAKYLDALLESLLENRPISLKHFVVSVSGIGMSRTKKELEKIISKYKKLFNTQLTLDVILELD